MLFRFEEDNIKVFIGRQENRTFMRELKSKIPRLDILIDDGGHQMHELKATFEEMFSHVKEDGGIYWAEDLHTSYITHYGGGFRKPYTFIEYAKNWIDDMNAYYAKEIGGVKPGYFTEHAKGVYFYDSVVVIEKQLKRDVKVVDIAGPLKKPHIRIPDKVGWMITRETLIVNSTLLFFTLPRKVILINQKDITAF